MSQYRIFSCLVFLFPLGMGSIRHYSSTVFLLLTLAGCWYSFKNRSQLNSEYRQLIAWVLIFCSAVLFSLINSSDLTEGLEHSWKILYLLALYPLLMSTQKHSSSLIRSFVAGLMVAGPLNLLIALYSLYVTGLERAQGFYHPIVFGDLTMLGGLLLASSFLTEHPKTRLQKGLVVVSMSCFFITSFLSGSRGALLAFPIVFPVLLALSTIKIDLTFLRRSTVVVLLFFSLFLFAEKNNLVLGGERQTLANAFHFSKGEKLNTSLGQRLLMWGITIEMFKENPLIGSGYGDFRQDAQSLIDGGTTELQKARAHAHNIFFDILGSTGLIGLLSMLMALFIVPLKYFISSNKDTQQKRLVRVAGTALVACFAIFGLTEGWLTRSPLIIAYITCLFIFASSYKKVLD